MKKLIGAFLIPALALAGDLQPKTYGDWVASSARGYNFNMAYTSNANNEDLAEYCYTDSGQCEWRFHINIICKNGTQGLVLINGENAYDYSVTTCLGILGSDPSKYTYKIENWRRLEEILNSSAQIGIAMPMIGGAFRVLRWSARGAVSATAYIGGPIVGERHDVGEKSTPTDTTL